MSESPAVTVEKQANLVLVHVEARDLDEPNTKRVYSEISAAVADSPTLPFILDMAKVKFVPSLTLGALVRFATEFRSRGQRLILCALQPTVRQVIAITRLDRILEVSDDIASATKMVSPG